MKNKRYDKPVTNIISSLVIKKSYVFEFIDFFLLYFIFRVYNYFPFKFNFKNCDINDNEWNNLI